MRRPDHTRADDAELLALTASDPDAFGVLYERYEAQLLGFFWRATRRADIAADLTAEVFAAALESAASFRPQSGALVGGCSGSPAMSWPTPGSGAGSKIVLAVAWRSRPRR